ncbi:DUF6049 family protein [Antribacter gilvus]|uniref:DUF6049 family protein n=1 Tax=Antribacter gilvus TaxID=2304675 RepID=UPI000F79D7C2|nr:DUF6049 family protein [Antribacter gilvus]
MTQQPSDPSRVGATGLRRPVRLLPRLAALAAALVVLGPFAAPATAVGPTPESGAGATLTTQALTTQGGTVSETAPLAKDPVTVELAEMSPATAKAGETVTITARVTNNTEETLSGARATLRVHWAALTDREVLDEWVHAPLLNPSDRSLQRATGPLPVPELAPGQAADVTFTYTPAGNFEGWGARRLAVSVTEGSVSLGVLRSFLVYDAQDADSPESVSPVSLSVALPVTGPAVNPGDPEGQDVELARLAAKGNRLDSLLEVARTGSVSLAVDPQVVAAATASGDPALSAWAEGLVTAAAATTTFTLPAYDPDPAALAHSGIGAEPVRSFQSAPLPGDWQVPAEWAQNLTWPAGGTTTDLATLRTAVATGRDRVVVGGGTLAPTSSRITPSGLADVPVDAGTASVVVSDAALTEAFVSATDTAWTSAAGAEAAAAAPVPAAPRVPTAQGRQWLLAEVAAIIASRPTAAPHVVVALPRTWAPDLASFQAITEGLTASGMVRMAPLADLLAQPAPAVDREPLADHEPQETELDPSTVAALERARSSIASFATVAGDSGPALASSAMPHLTAPLAVSYSSLGQNRDAMVQSGLAFVEATTGSVAVVPPRSGINLLTEDASIPVRVRNDLSIPVTVIVVLRPDSLGLQVIDRPSQTIPAKSTADVPVPVSAAAGSGAVDVAVQLLSPAQTQIGPDTSFEVRVQAEWEEIGTWIAAAGIGVLFVAGIWRTVRRGRSPNRATREDVEAATGEIARAAAAAAGSTGMHDAEHAQPAHARQPR